MQAYLGKPFIGRYSIGIHRPSRKYIVTKTGRYFVADSKIADVHLCGNFGIEALVHELQHACMNWCRTKKINPLSQEAKNGFLDIDSGEEKACYSIGYMSRQAVLSLNKKKIWP